MNGIIFDLDPVIFKLGPLQLRYYGIIFVTMLGIGFYYWRKQMLRGGYPQELIEKFVIWGVLAVVIGARLGHVLFYDFGNFISNPLMFFQVYMGGLASHGAAFSLFVVLCLFAIKYKLKPLEVLDRFSFSSAVGAALVRLGNFINSEIVGRETDLPWAVRFIWYDNGAVARHPSQLYEFFLGLFVLLVLHIVDKLAGGEKRPVGLLAGVFLTTYFSGRFFVEFTKEYQTLSDSYFTMGQYLSIVPFVVGVGLIIWSLKNR